jgi:hypothetical protein
MTNPLRRLALLSLLAFGSVAVAAPAAPAVTLSQNASTAIAPGTPSCNTTSPNFYTRENEYYRRFDLDGAHGITTAFTASQANFGIESANDGANTGQPLQVKLYSIPSSAALTTANLALLGSANATIQDSDTGTLKSVPVSGTVASPTTTDLVASIYIPDGFAQSNRIFVASNALAESAPTYLRAPLCGSAQPVTMASVGFPNVHLVLTVDGTAAPGTPAGAGGVAGKKCKKAKKQRSAAAAKKKGCKKKKRK